MLTWLAELPGAFHLFRYLTFRTLGAAATGLFLVFFFGPTIISALRLKQGKASRSAPMARLRIFSPRRARQPWAGS
jgi:hypothetical protein